jgi:hypothetical protein
MAIFLGCSPKVIVDSDLSPEHAIYLNQPPDVPADVQKHLRLVDVRYYGFDGKEHQGQIVVHEALEEDIRFLFALLLEHRFPVESALPISHPALQEKGRYGLSPDTNNTSCYVWRPVVASQRLSMHALGMAIDMNPRQNPYIKGDLVLPPQAVYAPSQPGTLRPDSPAVAAFRQRGWEWGGDWTGEKIDYMHFQKIPPGWETYVTSYRE